MPGNVTAENSLLDASGLFVNDGTILADGPTGNTFTLMIAGSTTGSGVAPGYFANYGTIQADIGNTLSIAIGGSAAFFNVERSLRTRNGHRHRLTLRAGRRLHAGSRFL